MSSVEKDYHPVSGEKYGTDASSNHRLDRDGLDGNCAQRRMQCVRLLTLSFSFVQVADPSKRLREWLLQREIRNAFLFLSALLCNTAGRGERGKGA